MRSPKPALKLVGDADLARAAPRAPGWLHDYAREEWRRVLPLLVARRILARADLALLASYCVAVGQIRRCEEILVAEGLVVAGEKGPKQHPASAILTRAQSTARQYGAELGLTPVSRSRAAIVDRAEIDDDFADLDL